MEPTSPDGTRPFRTGRAALALIALGLPGIASLYLVLPPVAGVPAPLMVLNPLVLLVAMALIGSWAAPRAFLSSRIAARASGLDVARLPTAWPRLLVLGAAAGIVIALADHATRPFWQPGLLAPPSLVESWNATATIVGVLYGGVVEEILMRWGLMSLFVLFAWKILSRHEPSPAGRHLDRHRAGGAPLRGGSPAGADGHRRRDRHAAAGAYIVLERPSGPPFRLALCHPRPRIGDARSCRLPSRPRAAGAGDGLRPPATTRHPLSALPFSALLLNARP